jgi:hypothetical protein
MNTNHQMAERANIIMPRAVVRTISLEKLRQPSPLAEHRDSTS